MGRSENTLTVFPSGRRRPPEGIFFCFRPSRGAGFYRKKTLSTFVKTVSTLENSILTLEKTLSTFVKTVSTLENSILTLEKTVSTFVETVLTAVETLPVRAPDSPAVRASHPAIGPGERKEKGLHRRLHAGAALFVSEERSGCRSQRYLTSTLRPSEVTKMPWAGRSTGRPFRS